MARKRASGVGSNSRRFARRHHPDGVEVTIPAAKDAATLVFEANADGSWPRPHEYIGKALYDATWIREGETIVIVEMQPGRGMGERATYQVVQVDIEADVYEGRHLQFRRRVLVERIEDYEIVMNEIPGAP